MRAPNFYAHPGFERAGLRRRESEWIRARVLDRESLFVPVWRSQSLVVETEGADAQAVILEAETVAMLLGSGDGGIEERLMHGHVIFLGLIDDRAHFALDLSAHDAPLDALRSPALAAAGIAASGLRFGDLRQFGAGLARHEGALLALARAMVFWHSRHRFCGVCGAPTRSEEAGHVRRCTEAGCATMHFPRTFFFKVTAAT